VTNYATNQTKQINLLTWRTVRCCLMQNRQYRAHWV